MGSARQPEQQIEAEKDSLESVAEKLGVELYLGLEKFFLTENNLNYLNSDVDETGNTFLMRFVKLGRTEIVEFLLKCDGILVNDTNDDEETAADVAWREKQYGCLLQLLRGDAEFPYLLEKSEIDDQDLKDFLEKRDELHEYIESGDLQSITESLRDSKPSIYLNLKVDSYCRNQSALSWAAECHQIKIFAYLINHGAKFKDVEEERECEFNEDERNDLNDLLSEYFLKLEDSHILKLLHSSHSPQVFTEERREKIKNLYEYLNQSEIVRTIMKVLEYEELDVVFDFESDHTNRIYCLNNPQIYGLTITSTKKIFIGARKCNYVESVNLEVAGTLAHELCHMAVQVVYRNSANPYEKWEEEANTEKVKMFETIVEQCYHTSKDPLIDVDDILKNVFKDYDRDMWHSELIVRVPHILGHYGDIEGMLLLQEQASDLFQFFSNEIVPKFKNYSNPSFFKRNLCLIESLHRYHGCIEDIDKEISPLMEQTRSFESYLIRKNNISLLVTSNTRLCCLHVYHELKKSNPYHMDKKCLFFRLDCYKQNWVKIINAFKCKVCRCMVLVSDDNMLHLENVSDDFENLDGIDDGNLNEEKKSVILIVRENCLGIPREYLNNVLSYRWSELSEAYKHRLVQQTVNFKGKETSLLRWVNKEKISQIIQAEDMLRLTNNQLIELCDGKGLISKGYLKDCYIERTFIKRIVEKTVFEGLADSTVLFITGLEREDIEKFGIDDDSVQWLEESEEQIDEEKMIFISLVDDTDREFFEDFFRGCLSIDTIHWLHYYKEEFYLRYSRGLFTSIEKHINEKLYTEVQLMNISKDQIVLISDDPGMGKSTVLSNIIIRMREAHPDWWVGRIDLNDYSDSKENPLGLSNIEEDSDSDDVLEVFIRMLGLKTKLEIHLFREFIRPEGLRREYKIFLDGYDEVSNLYKDNVMKLFEVLKEKTTLQLWVATRNHEKIYLETELDTCSYSMKQFSTEDQIMFLNKFWKHKMKSFSFKSSEDECLRAVETIKSKIEDTLKNIEYDDKDFVLSLCCLKEEIQKADNHVIHAEKLNILRTYIDEIDFSHIAMALIEDSSIDCEENKFMGIPLHLFMLGNVAYDSDFRRGAYSNVYKLYSEFVEGKIRIYWKEKGKVEFETNITQKMFNIQRKEIIKFHKEIADCVIEPEIHSWDSITEDEERDVDVSVGIVTRVGDRFQFIHRTFAEFFFAERLLEKIKSRTLSGMAVENLLLLTEYSVVVRFIYGAFQGEEVKEMLTKAMIEKWKLGEVFNKCLFRVNDMVSAGRFLLKIFINRMENVCKPVTVKDFISQTSKFIEPQSHNISMEGFKLLSSCLSDAAIFEIFEKNIEDTYEFIFLLIEHVSGEEIKEILDVCRRIFQFSQTLGSTSENGSQTSGLSLLNKRDDHKRNILFQAAHNKSKNVYPQVLVFMKEFLGVEATKSYMLDNDIYQRTILHECSFYLSENVLSILQVSETILDLESVINLLRAKDDEGANFLHLAAKHCIPSFFCPFFDYLREIQGGMVLREILLDVVPSTGFNMLHHAALNEDVRALAILLENLRIYLKDDDEFFGFVSKSTADGSIFHLRASMTRPLREMCVLIPYIGKVKFCKLLTSVNDRGENCFHVLIKCCGSHDVKPLSFHVNSMEMILGDLQFLSEILDPVSLEKFIMLSGKGGNTILHYAAMDYFLCSNFADILNGLRVILEESTLEVLINKRNDEGKFIRIAEDGSFVELIS